MELSRAVASTAFLLGVLLVVGHARGDDEAAEPSTETVQKKLEKREEARRAAGLEQRRRAELFEQRCTKPLKTPEELETCRVVYRAM